MNRRLAAAVALLLALAAASGGCRGGKDAASPAAGNPQQTPPDAARNPPTPTGTPSSVAGPISQDEAFSTHLSAASAFEIDLRTRQIYVYVGQRPPYMRAPAGADGTPSMTTTDRVWQAAAPAELVVSRRDRTPAYRIITPGQASWSPTAHILAFGSDVCGGGHLQLLDADTGAVRDATPGVRGALGYAWSPNGASIAIEAFSNTGPAQILLVDVAAGTSETLVQVPASRGGEFAPLAFSAEGGRLAFTYIPGRDFCGDYRPPPSRVEPLPAIEKPFDRGP